MASDEMYAFAFAVTFIVVFSALLATVPIGLQGQGATPDIVSPLNPSLLSGFVYTEDWNATEFVPWLTLEVYEYTLDGTDFICGTNDTQFDLNAKIYWLGLWLGQLNPVRFFSPHEEDSSYSITMSEIEADATDGSVLYNLIFSETGESAGGLIVYWNATLYSDPQDAYDNGVLFFLHGIGMSATADTDIIALLIGLLFLQLPDVPFLVNVLLVIPIWACIIFVVWFVIKESMPFV